MATGMVELQALVVGLGMAPRGEISLILARRGIDVGLLGENLYALIVFMVLGTTLLTPQLLRLAYRTREDEVPS